ncbi:hypothetical protein LXN10_03690 [Arcobacter sp. KX21116]|uniref:hypothetical protein n=1 Tax=Arcobacter iocasae TaxID=2906515 RepID=UPI0035D46D34
MIEAEKIYFKIDNVYYKFINPNECKEKELKLSTFNIKEFIDKCLEEINDKNNGSTSFSTSLNIQFKKVEIVPQYNITPEKIKEIVYNKLSISYHQEAAELSGLSFFIIFLSIFFGIP